MDGNRWHGGEFFSEFVQPSLAIEDEMSRRLHRQYLDLPLVPLPQQFALSEPGLLRTLLRRYPWLTEGMSSSILDISMTTNCDGQLPLPLNNYGGVLDRMPTD
jgi:hypothetical protein